MQQNRTRLFSAQIDRPSPLCGGLPLRGSSPDAGFVHGGDDEDGSCVWLVVTMSEDAWKETLATHACRCCHQE